MAYVDIGIHPRTDDVIRFEPRASGGWIRIGDEAAIFVPHRFDDAELFLSSLQAAIGAAFDHVKAELSRQEREAAVREAESLVHPGEEKVGEI